jgi:hypothetical protein
MEAKECGKRAETEVCLLQEGQPFLLELFLRFSDLSGVHEGEPLGNDVQQHHLGLS